MKLKDFLNNLNAFVKENPAALELDVVTSRDDEGNGYNHVHYTPSLGNFDGQDFDSEDDNANAVCLN